MAYYCNGKKGVCDCPINCIDCQYSDNSGGREVVTNGDRIRAMTDEELAKTLIEVNDFGCSIPFCKNKPECNTLLDHDMLTDDHCVVCMREWLKQEVDNAEDR